MFINDVKDQIAVSLPRLNSTLSLLDSLVENGSTLRAAIDAVWLTNSLVFADPPFQKEHLELLAQDEWNDSEEGRYILRAICSQPFTEGSVVYYLHELYGSIPAIVLSLKPQRIFIKAFFPFGTRRMHVIERKLVHQFEQLT